MDHIQNSLMGGAIIGLSAGILLLFQGRILGVSGIIGESLMRRKGDFLWRLLFIIGLLLGAFLINPLGFTVMSDLPRIPLLFMGLGGFLVGFGTTMGSGCTSGHGICGVSRLSLRSILATVVFMFFGFITVFLYKLFMGTPL